MWSLKSCSYPFTNQASLLYVFIQLSDEWGFLSCKECELNDFRSFGRLSLSPRFAHVFRQKIFRTKKTRIVTLFFLQQRDTGRFLICIEKYSNGNIFKKRFSKLISISQENVHFGLTAIATNDSNCLQWFASFNFAATWFVRFIFPRSIGGLL